MSESIRMATMILVLVTLIFGLNSLAAAQAGQKNDSCALLTKDEIKAAVGQNGDRSGKINVWNVSDGKLNTKANAAVGFPCEYAVGSGGAFSILIKNAGSGETADKMMGGTEKDEDPRVRCPWHRRPLVFRQPRIRHDSA